MASRTPRTPRPAAEKNHRADQRWKRLIHHLENQLGSKNAAERQSASEQLSKLLLAQANHKDATEDRQLRREELQFKKGGPPVPLPSDPAQLADTIAKLKAQAMGTQ